MLAKSSLAFRQGQTVQPFAMVSVNKFHFCKQLRAQSFARLASNRSHSPDLGLSVAAVRVARPHWAMRRSWSAEIFPLGSVVCTLVVAGATAAGISELSSGIRFKFVIEPDTCLL